MLFEVMEIEILIMLERYLGLSRAELWELVEDKSQRMKERDLDRAERLKE